MVNETPSSEEDPEVPEPVWPLYPDPVSELVEAIAGCATAIAYAMGGDPEAEIPLHHSRLADALLRLHNRWLEVELGLLQVQTKGRSSSKPMLIADRINSSLLRLGVGEEGVRAFWAEFYSQDGPTEPDAKRQAASRAAREGGQRRAPPPEG